MLKRSHAYMFALTIGTAFLATGASAQVLSKQVHGAFTTLQPSDRKALDEAIGKLFEADKANVGEKSDWSSTETGRHGTVTVGRYFDKADMHCRRLKFEFNSAKSSKTSVFYNNICKLPSGERKFL